MALLDVVATNAVTGGGPPWYTSGVHRWNGTTPSLNQMPVMVSAIPARSVNPDPLRGSSRSRENSIVPVSA